MQKINFTQEEFEKLPTAGKPFLQSPIAKNITKKPKKTKNAAVHGEDDEEESHGANKEIIDRAKKLWKQCLNVPTIDLNNFEKSFASFFSKKYTNLRY